MFASSLAETKGNLSAILAALANGSERERIVKNRNVLVAAIVPYGSQGRAKRRFGFAKDDGKAIDWDAFDALDAEIADDFGV